MCYANYKAYIRVYVFITKNKLSDVQSTMYNVQCTEYRVQIQASYSARTIFGILPTSMDNSSNEALSTGHESYSVSIQVHVA